MIKWYFKIYHFLSLFCKTRVSINGNYYVLAITATPTLNPDHVYVVENGTFTLTCSTSNGSRDIVDWFLNKNGITVRPMYSNEDCEILEGSLPAGTNIFCFGNNTYSLTVGSVTRNNSGDKWQCDETIATTLYLSNIVTVDVYGKRSRRRTKYTECRIGRLSFGFF